MRNSSPQCPYRTFTDCESECLDENCPPVITPRPRPPAPVPPITGPRATPRPAVPAPTGPSGPSANPRVTPPAPPLTGGSGRYTCENPGTPQCRCRECSHSEVLAGILDCTYISTFICERVCCRQAQQVFTLAPPALVEPIEPVTGTGTPTISARATPPVGREFIQSPGGSITSTVTTPAGPETRILEPGGGDPEGIGRLRVLSDLSNCKCGDAVLPPPNVQALIPPLESQTKEPVVIDVFDALEKNAKEELPQTGTYNEERLYHPRFNFHIHPADPTIVFVENNRYLDIFKKAVAREVKLFIEYEDSTAPWIEDHLTNLTSEKIVASLNVNLLTAFNNILFLGGIKVDLDYFIRMVYKMLTTGRLNELDPFYYKAVADRQAHNERIEFANTDINEYVQRAALGTISVESILADPEESESIKKNQLKRVKLLNTDIEAAIPVIDLSGIVQPVFIADAGLPVVTIQDAGAPIEDADSDFIGVGDGAGYYFSGVDIDDFEVPIFASTLLSSTFYVPPSTRFNILKLIGENPAISLITSSASSFSELETNYTPREDLEPLYFAVELSTVGDMTRRDALVDQVSAQFVRMTLAEAQAHSHNYGYSVTRVNIDHRDPFIHYAKATSSMELRQADLTFRSFDTNRTAAYRDVVSRNIPFGIVLVPGAGSNHNPLEGESRLSTFTKEYVERTIQVIPDFNKADSDDFETSIDEIVMFNALGINYLGLAELDDQDTQNVVYEFNPSSTKFSRSYFLSGVYSSAQPEAAQRDNPTLSILVSGIIDDLISRYAPDELTWWDVFRRMKFNDIAKLGFDGTDSFFQELSKGFRSGVPIRLVLNRLDTSETGLPDDLDGDDVVIITDDDRKMSSAIPSPAPPMGVE
jgi:hypothetical protein